MEYMRIYDKICRELIQYTSVNNANMFTISNSPVKGEIGIKKDGEVIIVINLYGNVNKIVPPGEIKAKAQNYPFIHLLAISDGNVFSAFDYNTSQYQVYDFSSMISFLIELVRNVHLRNATAVHSNKNTFINSLTSLALLTGIEHFDYDGKDILLYDDHRTTLNVLFEAHQLGLFGGQLPNIVTFDYHEDCCPVLKASELLNKIGVKNLMDATSRQFRSFVEFDLSKVDDDWIAAAQELNLAKDVVIIGNEANNNVENGETIMDEQGNSHKRYSIPHLSFSIGGRGCLGDSMIKAPYYIDIRDCLQYHNGHFDFDVPIAPFILDIDLDCFSDAFRDKTVAWPEQMFCDEFFGKHETAYFIRQLIKRASFVTISRESACCGGIGESNKILGYLDRYWFDGALGTKSMV